MIKVEKLSTLKGGSKYGTCINCGTFSEEDDAMVRITMRAAGISMGSSICLCDECKNRMIKALRESNNEK